MLLILSARSVGEDIALHYGRLPPSFLPLGNQRLFELQAELASGETIAMTVPKDFDIPMVDMDAIERIGIRLLPQPQDLSLTQAIKHALKDISPQEPLRLLYGDTLVRTGSSHARDLVAVQNTTANYQWAYVTSGPGPVFSGEPPKRIDTRRVVCGYYVFEDPSLLAKACQQGGIVDALNFYNTTRPLAQVEARDWYDFGHLPLYFQSKKSIMIKREFNQINYENHLLVKQSTDTAKIRAEAHWYENLPGDLQIHIPRYRGRVERDHQAGYAVEYLYHPLLSDLVAFGTLPLASWLEILSACFEVSDKCRLIRPPSGAPEASPAFAQQFFDTLIIDKTWIRLTAYAQSAGISLDDRFTLQGQVLPPLRQIIERLISEVPQTQPDHIRFWHGDLFFGNMFYDFTAQRILTIDPRGQLKTGESCLYGDWRYDLAKLAHSVVGQYDRIILGRARLQEYGPRDWSLNLDAPPLQAQLEDIFIAQVTDRYKIALTELLALTALLFFSMLPLHSDRPDLQRQLMANGLRLACRLEGIQA